MFGPHLIIDGSRCDTRKLADRILVEQVLNEYPTAIGMTKIGGPYMFEYQAPDPAYSGVSGLVVIAESHIAIHTFPELDYFTMDIFSCKNFDHEIAIEYIRKAFDVKDMDRMLVQRGLSFKGPHHGRNGATNELIAAAEARLAAGIISNEPALPDDVLPGTSLLTGRDAAADRIGDRAAQTEASAGAMIWPAYGVTPDIGTYGSDDVCEPCARGGNARVAVLDSVTHTTTSGKTLVAHQPFQVNPTASVSGMLDKMSAIGGQGRMLGRSLAIWEQLVRDTDATIALALTSPSIASGLRELLVYAIERRYVDVVVASADDVFADLYEATGHAHFTDDGELIATEDGRDAARALLADYIQSPPAASARTSADFWHGLGTRLGTLVPRTGMLQAAASGVSIFTPDLGSSQVGSLLLEARLAGVATGSDVAADVEALARQLAARPRLGVIRVGEGMADALVTRARDVAPLLGISPTTLSASISLDTTRLYAAGAHHQAIPGDASLLMPLLVTGLAQRLPGIRQVADGSVASASPEEPALA